MPLAQHSLRHSLGRIDALGTSLATAWSASSLLVLAIAVFLAARRAMGAMSEPLAPLPLLATALVMLAWMLVVRAAWRGPTSGPANVGDSTVSRVLPYLPWVSLLLVAYACSYPGGRVVDWLVWAPTMAAAWFGPRAIVQLRRITAAPTVAGKLRRTTSRLASLDEQLLQQLTRCRTADGRDVIRGTLVAEFAPGQRSATLYVAFCPPFERLPQVAASAETDGPAASVKLTQMVHNGAQLDVRLPRATDRSQTVAVELVATESDDL